MKKFLVFLLALVTIVSFASCGTPKEQNTTGDDTKVETTTEGIDDAIEVDGFDEMETIELNGTDLIKETDDMYISVADYSYNVDDAYIILSISNKANVERDFSLYMKSIGDMVYDSAFEMCTVAPGATDNLKIELANDASKLGITSFDKYCFEVYATTVENKEMAVGYEVVLYTGAEKQNVNVETFASAPFYSDDSVEMYYIDTTMVDGMYDISVYVNNKSDNEKSCSLSNIIVNEHATDVGLCVTLLPRCYGLIHISEQTDDNVTSAKTDIQITDLNTYSDVTKEGIEIFGEQ